MGKLMDDILHTADSFTVNFSDKGTFDYSVESLERVDALLEEFRDFDWEEDHLYNLVSMVGCYVFETARRNYGGEYRWAEKQQQPVLIGGLPDFYVSVCVWEKVRGRIVNGPEDSIPFYIQGYKEHMEIGRSRGKSDKGFTYSVSIV